MHPIQALSWICVSIFGATGIITLLALIGIITLGGRNGSRHDYYLRRLFNTLIIELIPVSIGMFYTFDKFNVKAVEGVKQHAEAVTSSSPNLTLPIDTLLPEKRSFILHNLSKDTITSSNITDTAFSHNYYVIPLSAKFITLETAVYASSDEPKSATSKVNIPEGYNYVDHKVEITTRNREDRTNYSVDIIKDTETDDIISVSITVTANEKALFGPRNWIGAILLVTVEPEPDVD